MHWTKLRLTGASVLGAIDLPIEGASSLDLFVLQCVDGLGAPEIDVSISNGTFQARQARERQIVAKVGLNPDWSGGQTPGDLRNYIYGMLTGGYTGFGVSAIVMDGDDELFRAEGIVAKIEDSMFSKDSSVQITINCLSPYFHALYPVSPLSGGGLTDTSPGWLNLGSAPAGFYLEATIQDTNGYFEISTEGNVNRMAFAWSDIGEPVLDTKIFINTVPNQRMAKLWVPKEGGYDEYDLLSYMSSDSNWLTLHSDFNQFDTNLSEVVWDDIHYTPLFWGV